METIAQNGTDTKGLLLRRLLERKSGHAIQSPADCEWLAMDMRSKMKDGPSVNTLKRLLGFLPYNKQHRDSTLAFIVRYLGYDSISDLRQALTHSPSDFGSADGVVESSQLKEGQRIEVSYQPDRTLTFVYEKDGWFTVEKSINSKLQPGDNVEIRQFALHFPLLITNVKRQGRSLGPYTAAKIGGLTSIKW